MVVLVAGNNSSASRSDCSGDGSGSIAIIRVDLKSSKIIFFVGCTGDKRKRKW